MRDLVQHESLGERGAVRGVRLCDAIILAQSARATLLHYAKCACAEQHSHLFAIGLEPIFSFK